MSDAELNRSSKNKTISLSRNDKERLSKSLLNIKQIKNNRTASGVIQADCFEVIKHLPEESVNLLILDPPYNMNKSFNGKRFSKQSIDDYTSWLDELFHALKAVLHPQASIYICGDWHSSISIYTAAARHFIVRNRISWEREKGRGARENWKNSSEDIWFCTMSNSYTFNLDQVKLRRRVIAPYRDKTGAPKDWNDTAGGAYRDTHPSNIWTDITIPFWSMPENTDHPTQKSEKLIAKLILASSSPGDLVFDPFVGSGSSCVVAKKLGRRFIGTEIDETYCLLAARRLELADEDKRIQGFADGVFWERNTLAEQLAVEAKSTSKKTKP